MWLNVHIFFWNVKIWLLFGINLYFKRENTNPCKHDIVFEIVAVLNFHIQIGTTSNQWEVQSTHHLLLELLRSDGKYINNYNYFSVISLIQIIKLVGIRKPQWHCISILKSFLQLCWLIYLTLENTDFSWTHNFPFALWPCLYISLCSASV